MKPRAAFPPRLACALALAVPTVHGQDDLTLPEEDAYEPVPEERLGLSPSTGAPRAGGAEARERSGDFYVFAGYGYSDAGYSSRELDGDLESGLAGSGVSNAVVDASVLDDTEGGLRAGAGCWLHPRLALEAGFADLGSIRSGAVEFAPGITVDQGVQAIREAHAVMGSGWTVSARGLLVDTRSFDISAKVGAFFWESENEFSIEDVASDTVQSFSDERSGTDLTYGAGLHYSINPEWALQLEWENFDLDQTVSLVSLSVRYSFDL